MDGPDALLLAAVGIAAGFLSSLFGIGGGIVMVPALHYGLGVAWHQATALSLLAIALTTPTGVFQHARRGAVDWRLAWPLAAGGGAGVAAGVWLEPRVPVAWLKLLFALLMAFAAARLVGPPLRARLRTRHPAAVAAVGAAAGTASKLLGIGGGLVTVPALALLGTAIHAAVASSLVPVFTNAALATAAKLALGASLWPALALAAGGFLGVPLGARAAHALPERGLRRAFAAALALAAASVAATSGVL